MNLEKSREPATVATVNRPSKGDRFSSPIISEYSLPPAIEQAARKVAARFGLTISVATVVATLAGLGGAA